MRLLNEIDYLKARIHQLEWNLDDIKLAKEQYNSVKSKLSSLTALVNVFENSSALKINKPLSVNSGAKIENIIHTVSSTLECNEFSTKVSQLNSDVDGAYSVLINKENEIINEIEILKAEIVSLERQIAEEEKRIAKEEAEAKKYEIEAKKADRL